MVVVVDVLVTVADGWVVRVVDVAEGVVVLVGVATLASVVERDGGCVGVLDVVVVVAVLVVAALVLLGVLASRAALAVAMVALAMVSVLAASEAAALGCEAASALEAAADAGWTPAAAAVAAFMSVDAGWGASLLDPPPQADSATVSDPAVSTTRQTPCRCRVAWTGSLCAELEEPWSEWKVERIFNLF